MFYVYLLMILCFIGFVHTINKGAEFLDEIKTPEWLKVILGVTVFLLFCLVGAMAGEYLRNSQ